MSSESASKGIKLLGGFELITKIGQGGMGTVFKARQISLDRDVALKVLPPKIAQSDPVFIERFIREARTSAKLNHPNIVQGIEVGKDDTTGLYYFAMEYIDGATIKTLLKQEGPIREKRAAEIAMGVTQALICAHRAGIVHRDIKPDNILLTSRGEPKLADLGLARHALDNLPDENAGADVFGLKMGHAELTQAGSAVGTPSYMAPEQIKAEMDKIDARTDLYAMGATLFHMVTGRTPYVAENSRAVMMQHLTASVPDPRSVNPAVSEGLSKLIMRLLQKEPNKRVSSAEELARELDKILNGPPAERLRRGSGKQLAVRDSGRHLAINDGSRPATGDHSANRTGPAGAITKGTKSHLPVGSRKVLYIGVSVAFLAFCGIVYAFFASSKPAAVTDSKSETPPPGQTTQPNTNVDPRATANAGSGVANTKANGPKWEPFDKAMKAVRGKPQDYANNIRLLDEAEKGAPPVVIADVRHERSVLERERDATFQKMLDELVRKARDTVGGGKGDFVTALSLFKDGAIPEGLLTDANRAEFARVHGEFEVQTFNTFKSVADGIRYDMEHSAAESVPKLQALLQKLEPLGKQYPVKAVQDRIVVLRKEINEQIQVATAIIGVQQESTYCHSVEAAWSAARNGDYNEGIKALQAVRNEPAVSERFGAKADLLKRDLETVRDLVQKSSNVLTAKLSSKEDVLLHPAAAGGGTQLGKITAKDKEGTFTFDSRDAGGQSIDPDKLDAQDLLALSGNKADGGERRYLMAICTFWQGRPPKAYESFTQLKKESSDSGDAAVYLGFMNFRASELIARITENYREFQNNTDLSPEQKKAKQAEAQAMMVKLKTDYSATEAYNARKQKK